MILDHPAAVMRIMSSTDGTCQTTLVAASPMSMGHLAHCGPIYGAWEYVPLTSQTSEPRFEPFWGELPLRVVVPK